MKQDANKILDNLSAEWANTLATANKKVAILKEENQLLKEQVKTLEGKKQQIEDAE